jgi:hypothetical protein
MSKLSKSIEQRGIRVSLSVELTNDAYQILPPESVSIARDLLAGNPRNPVVDFSQWDQPQTELPQPNQRMDELLDKAARGFFLWVLDINATTRNARHQFTKNLHEEIKSHETVGQNLTDRAKENSDRATTAESELTAARADAESKARLLDDERATNARLAEELAALKARDKTRAARQRSAGKKAGRK